VTQVNEALPRTALGEHPHALLELALRRTASELQLAELGRHTVACSACAALLALGPTLASKVAQAPNDETRDRRAVAMALSASRSASPTGRARLGWGLAASAALVGSVAAAEYLGVIPRPSPTQPREREAEPKAPAMPTAKPAAKLAELGAAAALSKAPASAAGEAEPSLVGSQSLPAPPSSVRGSEPESQSSAELFAAANQLRRTGQDAQAIQTFHRLQRVFPTSGEAAVSHATLGSLLLQRGDAQAALSQFDRYVAHGGPVLEEALAGRARALARLGDGARERGAWQALLARFPRSVHAARARARLAELR